MTDFTLDFIANSLLGDTEDLPDVSTFIDDEPSSDPDTGANGGFGGSFSDLVNHGVSNGAFSNGPPDPSANLTVGTSTAASNFMPNWRFVQSSNTNITAKQVRDTGSPSGSNLRFTFASGAAADEAIVEQIVNIGGSRRRYLGDTIRAYAVAGSGNTGTFTAIAFAQYLDVNLTTIGMPAEQTLTRSMSAGSGGDLFPLNAWAAGASPPATARALRIRLGVKRGGAANSATGTIDFSDVRRDAAKPYVLVAESSTPSSHNPGQLRQLSGTLYLQPEAGTAAQLALTPGSPDMAVLEGHLRIAETSTPGTPSTGYYSIYADTSGNLHGLNDAGVNRRLDGFGSAFVFSDDAAPGTATVTITPSAQSTSGLGSPRIVMPHDGTVVGIGIYLTSARTAGTLQAQVNANLAGLIGPIATINAGTTNAAIASASPGSAGNTFSAGDQFRVNLTGTGFTPTANAVNVTVTVIFDLP